MIWIMADFFCLRKIIDMRPAKAAFLLFAAVALFVIHADAFGCNVCHSKNPKMVKMHKELEYKDCFNCHGIGQRRSPEDQKRLMVTDQRCIRCHKK